MATLLRQRENKHDTQTGYNFFYLQTAVFGVKTERERTGNIFRQTENCDVNLQLTT